MWFRLAGANWSGDGNSLGSMSSISGSWTVQCTTSGGISKTTGAGFVTQGGTWTGTFTLSTGATFTSATLTPTSAGTVTHTVSSSTVTITIRNVSANCTLAVVATGGSGGGDTPVNPPSGGNVPLTFYDHSNGNDWYVMYSKNDETAGTTMRYGLNTSNSTKAKNYVCALENGATYRITFKNNTAGAYRCRMVTFLQPYDSILKSALSADASTGTTTTNVIYYDRDNTVSEYTTTFTNTLNHKTLAMTLGWATTAKGTVDIDVTVTKIGAGTPETDDGELITGLYTTKDFFLKTGTDSTGATITVPVASDTNNARNFVCELENGATYTYSYTNSGATSTYRTVIATFAPTMDNIKIAPLGSTVSGIDASTVSGAVKVLHEAAKQTEGTYTGTFTNTENAKTLIMFVGWGVDASNVTASVKKIS